MSARETKKKSVWGTSGRKLLVLSAVVGLGLAGCSAPAPGGREAAPTPAGQVVTETPPSPKPEVSGVAPSAAYFWVGGYWAYHDKRWVWVPGRWELRPRPNALWSPGHWNKTATGWVWAPGHWD
ncbi:MAG: hypothetical protein ACLQVX_08115 [Limisphaerales bacterium]